MTRALPRTNFHSSQLLRFLADLSLADAREQEDAFAEKLGLWLDFTDAITLCAVHNAGTASPPGAQSGAYAATRMTASNEFTRIQTTLVNSITKSGSPSAVRTRTPLPTPHLELPLEPVAAYAPYRRYYLAQQRDMELSIRPLRSQVREALASSSLALGKLAALDEALDHILQEREASVLSRLPTLFGKRFAQLYGAHQQTLANTGREDDPSCWMHAGAWLARFCSELQTVLLAELDLRLQPSLGLIEALHHEMIP